MKEISYKNTRIEKIAANTEVRVYENPGGGVNIDIHYVGDAKDTHLGQLYLNEKIDKFVKMAEQEDFGELLNKSYNKPGGYYIPKKIKGIQIDRDVLIEIFYRAPIAPIEKDKSDIKLSEKEKESIYIAFNFLNETKEIFEAPDSGYIVF